MPGLPASSSRSIRSDPFAPARRSASGPADPLKDRGAEQEFRDAFGLALEDLGDQVSPPPSACCPSTRRRAARVRVTGEQHRGEPQARDPSLGPCQERGSGVGGELDDGSIKQFPRLLGRKPKVDGTQLSQPASQAEAMQSQGRVMAGGQDQVPWPPREQKSQLRL
jgi:hypothetical protein